MGPWSNRTGLEMGRSCWSRRAGRSNRRRAHLRQRGRLVGDNGILIPSRRRAIQGGSYRGFRIVDEDRLVAALARNLGHGVSASQRAHDRRAPVRRSGSIHPGNADGHLSGDDGPGDPVAYARLLAYRLGFPGQSKPEMASGLLDNRWKFAKRKILSGEHYDTRPEAIHIWSGPVLLWNVEEAERARRLRRHDESPGGAATCGLTNARTCAIPPGGGL